MAQQISEALDSMTISQNIPGSISLEKYFPTGFKIYECNATGNNIIKSTFLSSNTNEWLLENIDFIFQCLLCRKEMKFATAFKSGESNPNRSHLFTEKHTNKAKNKSCVGIMYATSHKFIMCLEKDFNSGNIFEATQKIKRGNRKLCNNKILNGIFFGSTYEILSFDWKAKQLTKTQNQDKNIVKFIHKQTRPCFKFNCLLCNKIGFNYSTVVEHLLGRKHAVKLNKLGKQVQIITVKDYDLFILCDIDQISNLLRIDHLSGCLEEILITFEKGIIVKNCLKNKANILGRSIDVSPIKLHDGRTKTNFIKLKTQYNYLPGSNDDDFAGLKLVNSSSPESCVNIYQYFTKNFEEAYLDNILLNYFFKGFQVWCCLCQKGIYSLAALQTHLSSTVHNQKVRGSELVGYMLYCSKKLFIIPKGEVFFHFESARNNKSMKNINLISDVKQTSLNNSLMKVYANFFNGDSLAEAIMFCCLACYDTAEQKLMYLHEHELSDRHKSHTGQLVYCYCSYCHVIYIDNELKEKYNQFQSHFASHLRKNVKSIQYTVYNTNGVAVDTKVDDSTLPLVGTDVITLTDVSDKNFTVSYSKNFMQFSHPGISTNDFLSYEKWDCSKFLKYSEICTRFTGKSAELFSCAPCDMKKMNKTEILQHLLSDVHQRKYLCTKMIFVKFCDVCGLIILSSNLSDILEHFIDYIHKAEFSKMIGIPTFPACCVSFLNEMSKSDLSKIIGSQVSEMKSLFATRDTILKEIEQSVKALLSHKFPNMSVSFYGSRMSGLALTESDVDAFLNIGNQHVAQVEELFKTENDFFKLIKCLIKTSVPLIIATHKASGRICEFTLEDGAIKPHISKLIKLFTDIDERVLWLLAAVRYWAKETKIKDTNMFSSHAINWMVLFYLMQPDVRIIPSVQFVIKRFGGVEKLLEAKDSTLKWKSSFEAGENKTRFDLLEGFFKYYFAMKFSAYKLYPSSGLIVPRDGLEGPNEDRPVYMQDPLVSTRNILFLSTDERLGQLRSVCFASLHSPWMWNE